MAAQTQACRLKRTNSRQQPKPAGVLLILERLSAKTSKKRSHKIIGLQAGAHQTAVSRAQDALTSACTP